MQRYAWLEREDGKWHFLTSLFADPADSTRNWSNKRRALEELMDEGWAVVRPYPKISMATLQAGNRLVGFGLVRTVH